MTNQNKEAATPSPAELQLLAEREAENVKGWQRAGEALESCTFHGRYAKEIASLTAMCKTEHDAAKDRLTQALDQIKHPPPEWTKRPQKVEA